MARSLASFRRSCAALALLGATTGFAAAQEVIPTQIAPDFAIWDVKLGEPVGQIPEQEIGLLACGTDGGPPSQPLQHTSDFATCTPEASGLREVYFTNDDEQDYIAKAMESEFEFLQGGTSIYAHPVIISALVDEGGIVRGIRIVTNDDTTDYLRRQAIRLMDNFKARFGPWNLACQELGPVDGEQPVGNIFIHEVCTGADPATSDTLRIEASYLRKKGQQGLNLETQEVNRGYYESQTRLEIVQPPYEPK